MLYAKAQLRLRGCGKALERSAEGIAERGDTLVPKGKVRRIRRCVDGEKRRREEG